MSTSDTSGSQSPEDGSPFLSQLYRYRWPLSVIAIVLCVAALVSGVGRMGKFSDRVNSMAEGVENPQPKMFDTRTDIWFDPGDEGLSAYRDVEAQFIAEDLVIVAFEEKEDPWGVFGADSLSLIEKLTGEFEKIPFVRNVRSLTSSPWIRNGAVSEDESGLIVTDLFDAPTSEFSADQRLERMIAVLGAEKASQLAGEEAVTQLIGPKTTWSDHRGEPRFIDSIISEDGRTAAVVLQVIRQRADEERLNRVFAESPEDKAVGEALYTIDAQGSAVGKVLDRLSQETGRNIHITGIPVIERHFPEVGQKDMQWLGLMFLVIAAVLLAVYRRVTGVILPLVVVALSIFAMNGLVWLKGDLINNLTASAPIILTAVGIADAVHLVTAYFLMRDQYDDKHALVLQVLRKNAMPVFLTSVTTALAFLSLTVSAIVPVKQLGYTAAIGTVAAYIISMTLVPAVLSLLPLKKKAAKKSDESTRSAGAWTDALADFVMQKRSALLWSGAFVTLIAGIGVSRLQVESDVRKMFPSDDPIVMDQNWIEDHLGGSGDLDLVFNGAVSEENELEVEKWTARLDQLELKFLGGTLSKKEETELSALRSRSANYQRGRIASNEQFLSQIDRFESRLEKEAGDPGSPLSVLTSFDSGLSVLRRMHQVQNENRAAFYRVPTESDIHPDARKPQLLSDPFSGEDSLIPGQSASTLSAQYYLQYENGAKPAENLSPFVSPDRRSFRLAARVSSQSSADMLRAYDRIRTIAAEEFPEIAGSQEAVESGEALSTMRLTGKHYLFMNMMERFTETLVYSLAIALLVITVVIRIVFRSTRVAIISMVPNVLPLVVPLAVFGLLGIALDGPAVIVATIALGICVDDTIHLLTKFSAARKAGESSNEAIRSSFRQVGSAITWTTVTLVIGFSVLSMSDFRPNMLIGALGASMVGLAWICDLLLTPALLSLAFAEAPEKSEKTLTSPSPEPAQ